MTQEKDSSKLDRLQGVLVLVVMILHTLEEGLQ